MKHYVYKIINNKTGSYYIGSRSHADPSKDTYMGSSKILSRLIAKEGIEKFNKEVLEEFSTRKQANQYEHQLIRKALLEHPEKVYNVRIPGKVKAEKQHNIRADIWNDYYTDIREAYSKTPNMTKLAREYSTSVGVINKVVEDIKIKGYRPDIHSEVKAILKRYKQGKSLKSLSEEYKCDIGTIKSVLEGKVRIRSYSEQYVIDKKLQRKKRKPLKDIDMNYVNELYQKGITVKDISKKLNVYSGTLYRRLKDSGVQVRPGVSYRKYRHPAWEYKKEILEKSKHLTKKELCSIYGIKDLSTLNKILKNS